MMFVRTADWHEADFLCPVGGAMDMTQYWCRRIQGETPYMCKEFGVVAKVYVGVLRTSCLMVKQQNQLNHYAHQG